MTLLRGDTRVSDELGVSLELTDFGEYTLLIAKRDPGQGIVWLAFASLITGIAITFYLPRRRIWARITPDGRVGLVWRSDRYVDVGARVRTAARRPRGGATTGRLTARPARSLQGRMASLHDLHRALFPTARPLGAAELAPERAEREVGWVRVLKPRVPAFEALETGDLAIIPGAALAVVAPRTGPGRGARRGPRPGPCAGRAARRGRDRQRGAGRRSARR